MYCKNCGKELSQNSSFCTACGTKAETENTPVSSTDKNKKTIYVFSVIISLLIAVSLCFTVYNLYTKYQMSKIRTFICYSEKDSDGSYYVKQDSYGRIYEIYNDDFCLEYEYEFDKKGNVEEFRRYKIENSDKILDIKRVYKRDNEGKIIKSKNYHYYNYEEDISTTYFLEGDTSKNRRKAKEDEKYTIVEYDKYNRITLWKNYYDGTENITKTYYNKYGCTKEVSFNDGEEVYRSEYELVE